MVDTSIKKSLCNACFTLPTPFSEDTTDIDREGLAENISYLDKQGASLFVPCGNTGEYYSLTNRERVIVTETTVDSVSKEGTVLAGAGGSTRETIELANQYAELGADAVLIMDPSHTYLHEEGLRVYYNKIADEAEIPVVIYKRNQSINDSIIVDIAEHDNVVGVKYAVNDINKFAQVSDECDDVVWVNGIAERFAPQFNLEGAEGFTTGIGNFVPKQTLALQDALAAGNWKRAKQIRRTLWPLENLRDQSGANNNIPTANNVPVIKHCMDLAGLVGGPVREPLVELAETDKHRAREYYEQATQSPQTRPGE